MKKAFTLAEVMIVLAIIGILVAILLPTAQNVTPDKNILKFKKTHNVIYSTIRELVNSDEYYSDGDLGVRPNGDLLDGTHEGDITYFCETFASVISFKDKKCQSESTLSDDYATIWITSNSQEYKNDAWVFKESEAGEVVDEKCKKAQSVAKAEIITHDNVSLYLGNPATPFGVTNKQYSIETQRTGCSDEEMANSNDVKLWCEQRWYYFVKDDIGANIIHRVFCMDVDEMNSGEEPFGYAIRADGKIVNGARANEWLEKSIQDKN